MSEPAAKPRPMIDLDEFERRLRRPAAAPQSQEDPLAELARLVGGHEDPFKTVFEQDHNQPRAQRDALAPVASSRARPAVEPQFAEPQFQEDFADFGEDDPQFRDPQLHGTIDPQAYARQEPPMPAAPQTYHAAPAADEGHAWSGVEEPVAPPARQAFEAPRSRRPLFVTAAIIGVGILGIGASFAYKSKSAPHDIATINALSGPTKIAPDSPGGVDVPNQDASILDKTPQQTPTKLADHRERPVDLSAQPMTRAVMADAGPSAGAANVPVPKPPAGAAVAQDIQSYGIGALIEPKKVKTVSVRSDGTLLPNDTPPQIPQTAAPSSAQAPHLSPPAAATTPKPAATVKSTARVVTTPKPAQTLDQLADANNDAPAVTAPPAPVPAKPVVKPKPVAEKPVAEKPVKVAKTEATDAIRDPSETAAPEATAATEGGAFAVQFAAPGSEQEAHEMTAKLAQKYGGDLSGHHLTYHRAKVGDKTVYRVRTAGLSRDEATGLCEKVKASGGSCFVAKN